MSYVYVNDQLAHTERKPIAEAIGAAFGFVLVPREEPGRYFEFVSPTDRDYGFGLSFSRDSVKGDQISVSGHWPRTRTTNELKTPSSNLSHESACDITVSANRGVDRIVADIKRRFMPTYDRQYALLRARCDETDAHARIGFDLATRIAKEYGARPSQNRPLTPTASNYTLYLGDSSHGYSITVQGDSVRFEHMSLDVNVAIRVLDALKKQKSEKS